MEYTLTITDKLMETPDTVTILFKQPALRKIKYRAGQYITVIAVINGRKYRRPYSISSVYGIDATLNITVKAIPGGVVSNQIVYQWQMGDVIAALPPMGDYVLPDAATYDTVYCWCAGSGITPNYALIRDILANRPAITKLVLVYANKNIESTIFQQSLQELATQYASRLVVRHIHTCAEEDTPDLFYRQRLDSYCVQRLLQEEVCADGAAAHFICGPGAMQSFLVNELTIRNVPRDNIFFESFHLEKDPALLREVIAADIEVEAQGKLHRLPVAAGTTLLEACLDADLDFSYSCQSGTCGLCKARVQGGRVVSLPVTATDVASEECLLCISFPATNQLKLQIL